MVKKIVFALAIATAAAGAAWAQSGATDASAPSAGQGLWRPTFVNAVPMLSIEAKNTAGIFGGMADSFIDPRLHDPNMEGAFLLAGGDLALGGSSTRVDLGFARDFGAFYLGAYFGGNFGNGFGGRTRESAHTEPAANAREDRSSGSFAWNTNLAVLLGMAGMGFRLDFIMAGATANTRSSTQSEEADDTSWNLYAQPAVALIWGADMGRILPWAKLGFRFPVSIGHDDTSTVGGVKTTDTLRTSSNSGIELAAGATYLLGDASSLGGELWFSNRFRSTRRTTETGSPDTETKSANSGYAGLGLGLNYLQTVDAGPVAIGFRPNLFLGVLIPNRNQNQTPAVGGKTEWEVIGDRYVTLATGIDLGATWQATRRMSLLTGVSIRFFDWTVGAEVGQNTSGVTPPYPVAQHSSWRFSGAQIDSFHLGLNFAASDAISMGLRLDPLVNGLFGNAGNPGFDFTLTAFLGK